MKKLSICIPTYNRSRFLTALLTSLVDQVRASGRSDEVEILVSDNASQDDTGKVASQFGGLIQYWRNPENIGPDANFLKLFDMASGELIWLPGDDDAIRGDTVRYILRMADIEAFDYIYLRTRGSARKSWFQRGAFVVSNRSLLRRVNIYTTFMTSQVIRAELIKPNLDQARRHLGGYMAYYWIFLEALARAKRCLVSEEREVFPDETENTGGYRFYEVWAKSVFDVLRASTFGGDGQIVRRMRSRMLFCLLLPITYRLVRGGSRFGFHAEDPASGLEKYYGSGAYGALVRLYLNAPKVLLGLVHAVAKAYAGTMSRMARDIR